MLAGFVWRLTILHIFEVFLARHATLRHTKFRADIQRVLASEMAPAMNPSSCNFYLHTSLSVPFVVIIS